MAPKAKKPIIPLPEPTTFQKHIQRWHNCDACPLCKTRDNHAVLYRWHKYNNTSDIRRLPLDLLVIGEAPGESEDTSGQPFTGDSGRYLSKMLTEAQTNTNTGNLTIAMTNIIACFPSDPTKGPSAVRPPEPLEVDACRPRLEEFIVSTSPRAILLVGKTAAKFFPRGSKHAMKTFWFLEFMLEIDHPAYLLRLLPSAKDTETSKARMKIEKLFRDLLK